jgi:hypothetical protein
MNKYKMITRQDFRLQWGEGKIPSCVERLFEERDAYRKMAMIEISEVHLLRNCGENCENERLFEIIDSEVVKILSNGSKLTKVDR